MSTGATPPSTAAISAGRDVIFEGLREFLDLGSSYARSAAEAAYRGDEATIDVHLRQLRACVVEALALRKTLNVGPSAEGSAS